MKITIIILATSFVADQLFQSKEVRQNKHKSTAALIVHVMMWAMPMLIFSLLVAMKSGNNNVIYWFMIMCLIHFVVEWCCIRMWTSYWYDKKRSQVVLWVLLEQLILNVSLIWLFNYFMS